MTVVAYIDEDTGLEVLSLTECVRLLESNELGRLAISTDDGPRIYPVNYRPRSLGGVQRLVLRRQA